MLSDKGAVVPIANLQFSLCPVVESSMKSAFVQLVFSHPPSWQSAPHEPKLESKHLGCAETTHDCESNKNKVESLDLAGEYKLIQALQPQHLWPRC